MIFPEKYRITHPMGADCFIVPFRGRDLGVIASIHQTPMGAWEHVSVSLKNRTPNWDEMCRVKDLFWGEEERCIEFHPKKSEYVNLMPHALHIWKPPFEFENLLETYLNAVI